MRTRLLILLVISLVVIGCTKGGSETSSTSTSTAATTPSSITTTTGSAGAAIDLDTDYPVPSGTVCFYLANYVAVPAGDVVSANTTLNSGGVTSNVVVAKDVLDATTIGGALDLDTTGLIDEVLGFLEVGDDPLQVSLALRDISGIQASPIHIVGFTSHIHFQPGTDPSPVPGIELPDVSTTALDGQYVAVVDSGIVLPDQGLSPNWFYGAQNNTSFVEYDPLIDAEQLTPENPASHGTFISGLIRQIAPSKRVTFAAARLVDTDVQVDAIASQGTEDLPGGLAPSSEIQVAEAMSRLIGLHDSEVDNVELMTALNLSLGTYVCDPLADAEMVTLNAMSHKWLETFPLSEIMSAAGNEIYKDAVGAYVPFWPAAFSTPALFPNTNPAFEFADDRFHAVAAADPQGTETVWDSKAPTPVTSPGRPWVTDLAPGADLVGLAGGTFSDPTLGNIPALVCWSGSSFATAVASAMLANPTTSSTLDYSVAGLTYIGARGKAIITAGQEQTTEFDGPCIHDATTTTTTTP